MPETKTGPLSHIKVVELGSFIAGPFCGQLLADLGASVIKIEPPGIGDAMRQWGRIKHENGDSLWWSVIGRNKQSLTLDLRKPEGRDIARRLILEADVLVENFRPGTLERWGLAPDDLRAEKPDLIVARVSGFGQTGPYAKRAGFGSVAEAMGGLRYLSGFPDRAPPRIGVSIGDSLAGMFGTIGVLAALVARPRNDGQGQTIDVSIIESVLAVTESLVADYGAAGMVRERSGSILAGIAPSNLYPAKDGTLVMIGANADGLFASLAKAMGRPELAQDERYRTHDARGANQAELDELIATWTATQPADTLLDLLEEHGIPAGPVNDAAAVFADPHLRERGAVLDHPAPQAEKAVSMQGAFPRMSGTEPSVRWAGATLGAHTETILRERLDLDAERIAKLRAEGIV